MRYFDPNAPAPSLRRDEAAEALVREEDRAASDLPGRWLWILILAVLLITTILFALRAGGRLNMGAPQPQEGRRTARSNTDTNAPASTELPCSLDAIVAIADRREALITLAEVALRRGLDAHGVLLGRSWTMRDALTHIPPAWPHRDRLAALALASEVAHFGGRPVSENAFQAHLADAAAILTADTP